MEALIAAFSNSNNQSYEPSNTSLSSKGSFELVRSSNWTNPSQESSPNGIFDANDLFQQLREDLQNLQWQNEDSQEYDDRQAIIDGVISSGRALLGKPYLWGGKTNPDQGLDCSGYIHYIYKQNGIETPTYSKDFLKFGTEVTDIQEIMPGDIICTKGHVRMVSRVENGQIWCLEAKGRKYGIVESPFKNFDSILSIRRVVDNYSPSNGKFNNMEDFVQTMNATYRKVLQQKGLDPNYSYILVAQDAIESGWGQHTSGHFNFGGIKAKVGSRRRTFEYINGVKTPIYDNFRDFSSLEEYCNYKIDLLSNDRYNAFNSNSANNPQEFMSHVNSAGYSTTPNRLYVPIFMSVYKSVLKRV